VCSFYIHSLVLSYFIYLHSLLPFPSSLCLFSFASYLSASLCSSSSLIFRSLVPSFVACFNFFIFVLFFSVSCISFLSSSLRLSLYGFPLLTLYFRSSFFLFTLSLSYSLLSFHCLHSLVFPLDLLFLTLS
jgi:hypothetical protein